MPTTFSNLAPIRRVAVGDCSGPLGSGFDALARSAYSALLRAEWTEDDSAPFMPTHDNGQTANKSLPHGDAWKCSYGYDAAARTERAACGAVCYTFKMPADATTGTAANISTVALSLTGDRYLDAGVDLYIVPSASPTPPSVSDLLALTPAGTYCATSDQSPTPPNNRHGVTAAVEWEPTSTPAQPYIHIALLLHDYTTNRGAWIEGGAMLEGAAATITFSRDVSADASASVRLLLVTKYAEGGTGFGGTPHAFSFVSAFYQTFDPSTLVDSDVSEVFRLAFAGRLPSGDSTFQRGFVKDANVLKGAVYAASAGTNTKYRSGAFYAHAYYIESGSAIRSGMQIAVPTITNGQSDGGTFRVALVQHASTAAFGESYVDTQPANVPAIDQVLDGSGPDIVAMTTGSISGNGTATPSPLVVLREPSLPFVSLVLVPIGRNLQLYADVPGVLVAS